MNKRNLFGLGLSIMVCAGAILYGTNGEEVFHYSSIIYLIFFIGAVMVIKAFHDALGLKKWCQNT
jgi:hypothetical protein